MKAVAIALLLTASAEIAQGQSLLTGRVLGADSALIVSAHVMLHDSVGNLKSEALTDSSGNFYFRIGNTRPVRLFVSIVRVGFVSIERVSVSLGTKEDVSVRVFMAPNAVLIAPVTVVARRRNYSPTLNDYYDKLDDTKTGVGHALEREVMEKYSGLDLVKALQRVPGVQYGVMALNNGVNLAVPRMRSGCVPLTYLDRTLVPPDQLATLDPGSLEGVLVYVGLTQIPPDYSSLVPGAECGMIMAYTAPPQRRRARISTLSVLTAVAAFTSIVLLQL